MKSFLSTSPRHSPSSRFAARQVGKTTLLQEVFPKADYVVFDPHIDIGNARSDPDLFLDTRYTPLILDEIPYSPEVVSAVKRKVDRARHPGIELRKSCNSSMIRSFICPYKVLIYLHSSQILS
ncbi:MAG: AAA family ATPase [Candidatus Riflebacteria bacterium]|nr:AAA family ATPase [Candidatus Riflebacteria bacterium]